MIGIDSASAGFSGAHLRRHLSIDQRPFQVRRGILGQIALPPVANKVTRGASYSLLIFTSSTTINVLTNKTNYFSISPLVD